jgi:hypothetical protein
MKFIFLALFFTLASYAEECVEGRSAKWQADGTFVGPYEKCFIKVSNASGGSLAKGSVVISDTSQANPHVVTTSTTAGSAPICVIAETCSTGAKCKCQTYGYTDSLLFEATKEASAGHLVFISENVAKYSMAEVKGSIAGSDVPIGTFLETSATSGSIKAFIKLR